VRERRVYCETRGGKKGGELKEKSHQVELIFNLEIKRKEGGEGMKGSGGGGEVPVQ